MSERFSVIRFVATHYAPCVHDEQDGEDYEVTDDDDVQNHQEDVP